MASNISSVLKSKRKELGLTVKEVITTLHKEGIDISDKTLYGWESGHRQPDADTFLILCRVYGITSLSEEIQDDKFTADEIAYIKKYRTLDVYGKRAVDSVLSAEYERLADSATNQATESNIIPLRLSTQSASAGKGTYLGPEEFETIMVEDNALTRQASFGVPVSGDSMEPTYHDGDILLVKGVEVAIGEIGIFTLDGDGYVKKRGERELLSLNPAYEPIPLNETIRCNGKVIGVLKKS